MNNNFIFQSLTGLRAFDALYRKGTINAASIDLNVTPGAISRQITKLEETLGRALFSRQGGRLQLTDAGRIYGVEIRTAFEQIERATNILTDTAKNRLVISCPPSFHFCWLLKRIPNFEALHSDITVVVHTELSSPTRRTDIDAVIGVGEWPGDMSMLQCKFMGNYSGPVMAPRIMPLDQQLNALPKALRLLTLRKQPNIWNDWFEETGRTPTDNPMGAEMDHLFLTIEAAKAGLGAAIAPYSYVADDLKAGKLIAPFGFLERKVPYFLARPAEQAQSSALLQFTNWLKKEGAKTPKPI